MTTVQLSDDDADRLAQFVRLPDAHAVLFHFGARDVMEPGSFVQALVEAITRADPRNRVRLALGFPGYVAAVNLAQGRTDGLAVLRAIATPPPAAPVCGAYYGVDDGTAATCVRPEGHPPVSTDGIGHADAARLQAL